MTPEELWRIIKHANTVPISGADRDLILAVPVNEMRKMLAEVSLDHKWYNSSEAYVSEICPFCMHLCVIEQKKWYQSPNCDHCLCPPHICSQHASSGFVHGPHGRVYDMDLDTLEMIVSAFKAV